MPLSSLIMNGTQPCMKYQFAVFSFCQVCVPPPPLSLECVVESLPYYYCQLLLFLQNEVVQYCPVTIIDDSLYEKNEKFHVKLLPYMGAAIGDKSSTADVIILADDKDGVYWLDTLTDLGAAV